MSDVERDILRIDSLFERRDVKTPHCLKCGTELASDTKPVEMLADITLYACPNKACVWWNLFVKDYDSKPRGHAVNE